MEMLFRHFALGNNLKLDEKVHILVKWLRFSFIQEDVDRTMAETAQQLHSQDVWMQSSSNFSLRNNCYETDENKVFLEKIFRVLVFNNLKL